MNLGLIGLIRVSGLIQRSWWLRDPNRQKGGFRVYGSALIRLKVTLRVPDFLASRVDVGAQMTKGSRRLQGPSKPLRNPWASNLKPQTSAPEP